MTTNDFEITAREIQILTLVADGRTNAEIGTAIGYAPDTVKKYLAVLAQKLGVEGDRTLLVAEGFRRGLLDRGQRSGDGELEDATVSGPVVPTERVDD